MKGHPLLGKAIYRRRDRPPRALRARRPQPIAHRLPGQYIFRMATTLKPSKQPSTPGAGVPTIWLDGKWYDRDTAKVSVYDHGLFYGDGVFEGIRVYAGKVFKLRRACRTTVRIGPAIRWRSRCPRARWSSTVAATVEPNGHHRRLHPPGRHPRRRLARPRPRQVPAIRRSSSSPTRSASIPQRYTRTA